MSKITEASRGHIADENFAFPKERKEPIHDAAHALKSELSIRPLFHQLERRVKAHVIVAFLGYALWVFGTREK
jgi:hypothetical protein